MGAGPPDLQKYLADRLNFPEVATDVLTNVTPQGRVAKALLKLFSKGKGAARNFRNPTGQVDKLRQDKLVKQAQENQLDQGSLERLRRMDPKKANDVEWLEFTSDPAHKGLPIDELFK